MLVASHTAVPIGTANGWGWGMQQTECPAVGRGHDEPYRLPMAGFPSRSIPFPAISVNLTADLYGWLLTSDAYRHLSVQQGYLTTSTTSTILQSSQFPKHISHLSPLLASNFLASFFLE
ncbi:MAG: hypothetical protein IJL54_13255 [Prevotella sp.]|nr:hypothetical protein [Prevotella sp.]